MERFRSKSGGKLKRSTNAVKPNVKNVKLKISPRITPNGRREPPTTVEDRTIGKIGNTHGVKAVTNPETKAKMRRSAILQYSIVRRGLGDI